jgi:hypothetical protein
MYKCYRDKIVPGAESFSLAWIVSENLLYLTMWGLIGYLIWPIWTPFGLPLLAIMWAVSVVVVQILLKKHNCSGCYYYDKWCHLGWGKISSAMFKQDSGDPNVGMKLSFFYIIPPPLTFLISLVFAIIKNSTWVYWFILVLFVILNAASFPVRKKSCSLCAMREACPGSAAKSKRTT